MNDVRERVSQKDIKASWAWKTPFGTYEFHGPNEWYDTVKGDCLWSAKADGWRQYLNHLDSIEKESNDAEG
jgi:hypothetical protein